MLKTSGASLLLLALPMCFAQQSAQPAHPPAEGSRVASPASTATAQVQGNLEVLTDTQGVDFGPYLSKLLNAVRENWYAVIPEAARPPLLKQGSVTIQFVILPDGKFAGMVMAATSGDASLDRAAWHGITASDPAAPLPKEFHGPNLSLRFHFYYNPQKPDLPEQTPSAKSPPTPEQLPSSSHQGTQLPSSNSARFQGNLEVMTNTQGVDFGPYLSNFLKTVRANWYAVIPEAARQPLLKQGSVSIQFVILPNGKISGMMLVGTSGDDSLDHAAWYAITASDPAAPLPKEFHGPNLALRFHFYYNPQKSDLTE